MKENVNLGADFTANVTSARRLTMHVGMHTRYVFECYGPDGELKWVDIADNTVVNVGLNDLLDKYFLGNAYTAAFYVGLTNSSPTPAAGDTMSSHSGWTEVTTYDESVRQTLQLGAVSSQSVDNGSNKAAFTVSANSTTIGGAFIATNSTKGGSAGVLYGIAAFSAGDKSLDDGDTLNVTATLTAASA